MMLYVICLKLSDGSIEPWYWSRTQPSKKFLRRTLKKFQKNRDVLEVTYLPYQLLYQTKQDCLENTTELCLQ